MLYIIGRRKDFKSHRLKTLVEPQSPVVVGFSIMLYRRDSPDVRSWGMDLLVQDHDDSIPVPITTPCPRWMTAGFSEKEEGPWRENPNQFSS